MRAVQYGKVFSDVGELRIDICARLFFSYFFLYPRKLGTPTFYLRRFSHWFILPKNGPRCLIVYPRKLWGNSFLIPTTVRSPCVVGCPSLPIACVFLFFCFCSSIFFPHGSGLQSPYPSSFIHLLFHLGTVQRGCYDVNFRRCCKRHSLCWAAIYFIIFIAPYRLKLDAQELVPVNPAGEIIWDGMFWHFKYFEQRNAYEKGRVDSFWYGAGSI